MVPGGMICMTFGAIVPFVLRKAREKWFELAGETYVHGIMDGQAMDIIWGWMKKTSVFSRLTL
jgi:hypothetical protein